MKTSQTALVQEKWSCHNVHITLHHFRRLFSTWNWSHCISSYIVLTILYQPYGYLSSTDVKEFQCRWRVEGKSS